MRETKPEEPALQTRRNDSTGETEVRILGGPWHALPGWVRWEKVPGEDRWGWVCNSRTGEKT